MLTRGRPDARTLGRHRLRPLRWSLPLSFSASVRLCVCAFLLACTDPRARPAPPSVHVLVSSSLEVRSPGAIPATIYATDLQGLDSLVVSLRSGFASLQGDSTYLIPDTTVQTTNVIWTVPSGVPAGTQIVLGATAYNLIGFAAKDSAVLSVQP